MSAELTLLPCPFCGGTPKMQSDGESGYWIECTNALCGSSTNMRIALMDDVRPLLVEQWNRRSAPVPAAEGDLMVAAVDLDKLEALARAATPDDQHIYTHPRDDNNWKANELWHRAAAPEIVLKLIAAARRAASGGQDGREAAAKLIEKKAQDYINENAATEHDTGATVWHYGDAGRDYHSSLVELAEELRAGGDCTQGRKVSSCREGGA